MASANGKAASLFMVFSKKLVESMLCPTGPCAYDSNHMKKHGESLDWPSLISIEPTADLIPHGLRDMAKEVKASADVTLFRTGDPVRHIYLVVQGEARLVRQDPHGHSIILQRSRGGFIAEASLDIRTYHCDAVTAEPTSLLLFPSSAFRSALEDEPAFRRGWQSLLAKEVRKLRAQCERLSLNGAVDRISHYIECEGRDGVMSLHQTRKSWAAELGLSHEALYRALRRMQNAGLLEVDGNRLATQPARPS
jgi:CRP-like cAMP-binding protein